MHAQAAFEAGILADIRAGVMRAANPERAQAVDAAVVDVIRHDFAKAVANIGIVETAECLDRLFGGNPNSPNARLFLSAVRAEFARRQDHRVAA